MSGMFLVASDEAWPGGQVSWRLVKYGTHTRIAQLSLILDVVSDMKYKWGGKLTWGCEKNVLIFNDKETDIYVEQALNCNQLSPSLR